MTCVPLEAEPPAPTIIYITPRPTGLLVIYNISSSSSSPLARSFSSLPPTHYSPISIIIIIVVCVCVSVLLSASSSCHPKQVERLPKRPVKLRKISPRVTRKRSAGGRKVTPFTSTRYSNKCIPTPESPVKR